jgi:hypothetical protein
MASDDEQDWQPEPDYDMVYPKIVRGLRRLINECGYQNVLGVFSSDMPEHREMREREEREERERMEVERLRQRRQRMLARMEGTYVH